MSAHVEWSSAPHARVSSAAPGEFVDGYGTANDKHVLILSGDDLVVIEGTPAELRALVGRMSAALGAMPR